MNIALTPEEFMLSRLPTGRVWNDRFWFYTAYAVSNFLGFSLGSSLPKVALALSGAWMGGVAGALLYRRLQTTEVKKRLSFTDTLRLWALFSSVFTPGCLIGALIRLSVE